MCSSSAYRIVGPNNKSTPITANSHTISRPFFDHPKSDEAARIHKKNPHPAHIKILSLMRTRFTHRRSVTDEQIFASLNKQFFRMLMPSTECGDSWTHINWGWGRGGVVGFPWFFVVVVVVCKIYISKNKTDKRRLSQ